MTWTAIVLGTARDDVTEITLKSLEVSGVDDAIRVRATESVYGLVNLAAIGIDQAKGNVLILRSGAIVQPKIVDTLRRIVPKQWAATLYTGEGDAGPPGWRAVGGKRIMLTCRGDLGYAMTHCRAKLFLRHLMRHNPFGMPNGENALSVAVNRFAAAECEILWQHNPTLVQWPQGVDFPRDEVCDESDRCNDSD